MSLGTTVGRRALLVAGGGIVLAGCASRSPTAAASAPTSLQPSASPTATPLPALPAVHRWRPDPNDLVPAAKLAAVRRIEALGDDKDHRTQVIDAQYGGLLSTTASVLVVCRSWHRVAGAIRPGGHTFDVRVELSGAGWRVTAIHPSRPGAAAARISIAAHHVLRSSRISLPPAARADVASGHVHDSALEAMLGLATRYHLGISVIRSGHPIYVFGTDRLSDHPQGRAFDTWQIDGHAVVARSTPRSLVIGYMERAAALGSYNVGGPYLLGAAPQYFSDNTHHDHVHAGFTR